MNSYLNFFIQAWKSKGGAEIECYSKGRQMRADQAPSLPWGREGWGGMGKLATLRNSSLKPFMIVPHSPLIPPSRKDGGGVNKFSKRRERLTAISTYSNKKSKGGMGKPSKRRGL